MEKWEQAFLKRWKKSVSTVMITIKESQYTMENARRKRETMEYGLNITRIAKITNIPVFNQIIFIYTGIELKFCRDLSKPSEDIIVDACFQESKNNNKIWWGIISIEYKFNHPVNYQSNRNTDNNFRPVVQSGSYKFNSGKRPGGYKYKNPVVVSGAAGFDNQLFRPIQYFTLY